jgi:hypothetical protein
VSSSDHTSVDPAAPYAQRGPASGLAAASAENRPARHTPGPWKTKGLHGSVDIQAGNSFIASVASWNQSGPASIAEAKANAHLIAAAPDLYDALIAVVSVADRKTVEFDKARAALAKARGLSS